MGLSAFNLMRLRLQQEEEAKKAKEAELASSSEVVAPQVIPEEPSPVVEKPKRKKTDAEKLKSKKN